MNQPGRNTPLPLRPQQRQESQEMLHEQFQPRQGNAAPARKEALTPSEMDRLADLFNAGRHAELESLARVLIGQNPDSGFAWKILGESLHVQGKDAMPALYKASELLPDDADVHNNLGYTLSKHGQFDKAVASYRRALEIDPRCAVTHNDLGVVQQGLGQLDSAAESYRRALEISPDFSEAHINLGNTLKGLGRPDEAVASYRRAVGVRPDYAEAHYNLGITLKALGRAGEAEASYRRALEIRPGFAEAHNNLALLLNELGKPMMALGAIILSLRIKETREAKDIFVACVKHLSFTRDDSETRTALVRALIEPWGRPSELVNVCASLVKLVPEIAASMARANYAWPQRLSARELFGSNGLTAASTDPLLCALLISAPISDIEMERFLTMARCSLLETATVVDGSSGQTGATLSFYSALAQQCFINEYAFSHSDDEILKAHELRGLLVAALEANTQIPVLWPVAVAAYFPLGSLSFVVRLLEMQWPNEVKAVLVQQLSEPEEEQQLRTTIPRLTKFEDEVSLRVQNQYEESPCPRWVKLAQDIQADIKAGIKPETMDIVLQRIFPLAAFQPISKNDSLNILIAGCGTGQHSIGTAQRFRGAQILAVDLSMASLSYARRKTREMGLTSIEYAQADLLLLGSLGRSFDIVESVGVLHHIADPFAGWRVLLSLLRPGGFMKLGFYSEVARRNIVRVRNFIAEKGYGSTASEIRRFRQDLMALEKNQNFGTTCKSSDFFSISTCRDLLFHVQEHRMTLTGINAFLRDNNLAFLGFEIDPQVIRAYQLRFPEDRAAINLEQWQIFENENPDIFFGMYQFWIQKLG